MTTDTTPPQAGDTFKDLLDSLGDIPGNGSPAKSNWVTICVCGHPASYHGSNIGGAPPSAYLDSDGCRGATPGRAAVPDVVTPGGKVLLGATCSCRRFRPVAEVDRPGRTMRQRQVEGGMHPFVKGLKALRTRLERARTVKDPVAEFYSRLRWLEGARKCEVCGAGDDTVWPSSAGGEPGGSMRCGLHREHP